MGKPDVCPGKKHGLHQSSIIFKGKKFHGVTLSGSHKLAYNQPACKTDFPECSEFNVLAPLEKEASRYNREIACFISASGRPNTRAVSRTAIRGYNRIWLATMADRPLN